MPRGFCRSSCLYFPLVFIQLAMSYHYAVNAFKDLNCQQYRQSSFLGYVLLEGMKRCTWGGGGEVNVKKKN